MEKQVIVSIGRQYGSAGHEIGRKLAEKLDIPFYDRNLFEEIGKIKNIDTNDLEKYDEVPRKKLFSRTVRGYSNSPEENVAELQFALLKSKWADGDSFVVVGRCADELFRGQEGFISVFIVGDRHYTFDQFIKRIRITEGYDLESYYKDNPDSYPDFPYYNIPIEFPSKGLNINQFCEFYLDDCRCTCYNDFD